MTTMLSSSTTSFSNDSTSEIPGFSFPLTDRIPGPFLSTQMSRRKRIFGFSLIELLVSIGVIAFLAVLAIGAVSGIRRQVSQVRDAGKLRQYAVAENLMMGDNQSIAIEMFYDPRVSLYQYTGDTLSEGVLPDNANIRKIMSSDLWVRMNRAAGKTLSNDARCYTVNQTLFPPQTPTPRNPAPFPWQKDPIRVVKLRGMGRKPLLFTGILNSSEAYISGQEDHPNPIYSGTNKTGPSLTVLGKTAVLFTDGSAAIHDFSKQNPANWWNDR